MNEGQKTKEMQIEEMANIPHKCIKSSCEDCIKNDRKCTDYKQAEALYNAGYRQLPYGAVILTPEERDEEMKEINKTLAERDELKAENERLKEVIADQNELCWNCKKSVQEFAKKLKKKLFSVFGKTICSDFDTEDITIFIDELLKE